MGTERKDRDQEHMQEHWYDFDHCIICGVELNEEQKKWNKRRVQGSLCTNPECQLRKDIVYYGCCDEAKHRSCVCQVSFECPVNGRICVGTHD